MSTLAGWLFDWLQSPQLQIVGWTLMQFLWQGAVIALLCGVGFLLFSRQARVRYAIGAIGMLLMLVSFLSTLVVSWNAPHLAQRAAGDLPWSVTVQQAQTWTQSWASSSWLGWLSTSSGQMLLATLTLLWALGVVGFQCRLWMQWRLTRRLRREALQPTNARLMRMVRDLSQRLRLQQTVRVLESATLRVPAVVGWFDPVVLVPAGVLATLTPDQLRCVLAHELAHVRRQDPLVNLLQCLTESLLFFHPAVWWLSNRVREDREFCCDDIAVQVSGDVLSYARTLQDLEELRAGDTSSRNGFGMEQAAVAATGGSLMDRITRLFGVQPASKRTSGRWAVPTLAAVLVATTLFAASCEPKLAKDPMADGSATVDTPVLKEKPTDDGIVEVHPDHSDVAFEKALWKLEEARKSGEITLEEYERHLKGLKEGLQQEKGQYLVVPMEEGGHFVLRGDDVSAIEDITGAEIQDVLLHKTGDLTWESVDGEQLKVILEQHPDAKAKFFAEKEKLSTKDKPHLEHK